MAGPYGRMCRDLFGESLHIKGKLVLDSNANLFVANAEMSNAHISGNLFTSGICEYDMGQGIMVKGNVTIRDGDMLCADIIKANTIIGNIQGNLTLDNLTLGNLTVANVLTANVITANVLTINNINGNTFGKHTGNVCGDVTGDVCGNIVTDEIFGKTGNTVSLFANLVLTPPGSAIISETLFTNTIVENTTSGGIDIIGNVCQADGYAIRTSAVEPKNLSNGVLVNSPIFKNRFGLGRVWGNVTTSVDNGNTIQVPLLRKSFESTFTTTRNVVHPNGNTLVTFQAPSTANVGCEFTSALVRTNVALAVKINDGDVPDTLVFTVRKNGTDTVSKFTHSLMGPCIDADQTFAWSDIISIAPDDTLDVCVFGGNISGNLDVDILPGVTETFATFEIESFE